MPQRQVAGLWVAMVSVAYAVFAGSVGAGEIIVIVSALEDVVGMEAVGAVFAADVVAAVDTVEEDEGIVDEDVGVTLDVVLV